MNKTTEWAEIMGAFRGLRLAVHSDLSEGNPDMVNLSDLKTQEALGWLVYHRLVWKDGDRLVPRAPREANTLWRERGPAREEAGRLFSTYQPPVPVPVAAPATCKCGDPAAPGSHRADGPCLTVVTTPAGEPAAAAVHPMRPSQGDLFA